LLRTGERRWLYALSHGSSGVALIQPLTNSVQVPRQELVHAFDRMIGDLFEDLVQIILGVEAVRLRAFSQRVDGRGALPAGIGRGLIMPWFRQTKSRSDIRFIP
jgi:hypothetical protein